MGGASAMMRCSYGQRGTILNFRSRLYPVLQCGLNTENGGFIPDTFAREVPCLQPSRGPDFVYFMNEGVFKTVLFRSNYL